MVKSFLEEDDTAKARESTRGGEEKLTESTSVCLNVLDVDARKTLSDGTGGLIGGENTLPGCADVGSVSDQLICTQSEQIITRKQLKTFRSRIQFDSIFHYKSDLR